jgi:nucleotide-binding universal stress UspA family protein
VVKTLSRILCAVDIDDEGRRTCAQAVAIARAHDARLLLVCAVPPGETLNRMAAERVACLLRIRREAEAAGVDVHTTVQSGEVAEVVLRHATARLVDLIVVGADHGCAQGHARGSIAEDVLRSAECATLVVPQSGPTRSSFARVLGAVDLQADTVTSLGEVVMVANSRDVHWTILHVVKSPSAASAALARIQSLIPPLLESTARGRIAVGGVATEVLRAARQTRADLIVIRARRRSAVDRRLFGVTRALLTRTLCPVLAIPGDNAALRRDTQAA